jgi:hypothetical protein
MSQITTTESESLYLVGAGHRHYPYRCSTFGGNMPKETRTQSHQYRQSLLSLPLPAPLPAHLPAPNSGLRPTSIWTPADDEILMNARAEGLNWRPISEKYFSTKTANACRKRHERLMERRNAEEWDGVKLESIATEYMEVRKQMWSILADRVGEKWQLVEAKVGGHGRADTSLCSPPLTFGQCMERGIKNLQAVNRSATRKARGMDDDSGIGSSEAEHTVEHSQAAASKPNAMNTYQQHDPRMQRGRNLNMGMSIHAMLSPTPSYSG